MNILGTRPNDGSHEVTVGGLSRHDLKSELSARQIQLNSHAQVLLDNAVFDDATTKQAIVVLERSVSDLGLPDGGTLSQIFNAAQKYGLALCPPTTGPYLHLAMTKQESSTDSVMNRGHAPEGSCTVAAHAFGDDDKYPKGFYLRVVNGQQWLSLR